ncbi:MAG: hypothetical protein J6J44_04540 [Lachnospiraceae bacterium]|nr:hypothetical protein [Lachnospiraceae bacterium]
MDMLISSGFLDMKPMEVEDISGGALNGMQIMYVSPSTSLIAPNAPIGGLYLPVGSTVVSGAVCCTCLS